jgi:CTP synthase
MKHIISAPDIDSIYDVPINFEKDSLGDALEDVLNLPRRQHNLDNWRAMVGRMKTADHEVNIGVVGKYFKTGDFSLSDSYISVIEALKHAGMANDTKVKLTWINTEDVESGGAEALGRFDGIVVPQGWGSRGSEGKIETIRYCRENKLPYFGLCYGMQMAVIEFARNVCGLDGANSEEVDKETPHPVIHLMEGQKELLAKKQYGGTIRLGGWPCQLQPNTKLAAAYSKKFGQEAVVSERHRHRYEFNNAYREILAQNGLKIAGTSPDGQLVEAVEITDHPFFIGTQFHPEYISRPLDPHPLFVEFVATCLRLKETKN